MAPTMRIWWLDGRSPTSMQVPMLGRFEGQGGKRSGVCYADEDFKGRPLRVRFLWLKTQTATPRWEQAFSTDSGGTWDTNWAMDFQRAG